MVQITQTATYPANHPHDDFLQVGSIVQEVCGFSVAMLGMREPCPQMGGSVIHGCTMLVHRIVTSGTGSPAQKFLMSALQDNWNPDSISGTGQTSEKTRFMYLGGMEKVLRMEQMENVCSVFLYSTDVPAAEHDLLIYTVSLIVQSVWKFNPAAASPSWRYVTGNNNTGGTTANQPSARHQHACDAAPETGAYCFGGVDSMFS